MKKIPDIFFRYSGRKYSQYSKYSHIFRLWNVCGQMEVGALLTCGSGIKVINFRIVRNFLKFYENWQLTVQFFRTRSLVAVKPRRPPISKTNVDTETAFRHDHCKTRVHIQKVNISEVRGQLIRSNSEVRVHAGAKFGHTGCWLIAKCSHPGTSQVDFQLDRPPPANSPPGDLLITMVKEAVILYKKSVSKNENKVVSFIDLKVMKTRNDCEIACDCSSVQTWFYM